MGKISRTKHIIILTIFISQALVMSIVESWIPVPVAIPGVKLGLANIITVVVISFFSFRDAVAVVFIRCILASFFNGGPVMLFFSLAGGLLSAVVMTLLNRRASRLFSIIGISTAGSIAHNIGQITVACIIMKEIRVATYLPILLVSGIITGCFIGLCSNYLIKALVKTGIIASEKG